MELGVEAEAADDTMESVRKGKGHKPFMEEAMAAVGTPDWLVDSLKRINYMFPKSHAVAYVMMGLRIAYFKIFYPREYYCCYFKRNLEAFDASVMVGNLDHLRAAKAELLALPKEERDRKADALSLLDILVEMSARGIQIVLPDLYASAADRFLIDEQGRILPPLSTLPGVSVAQAQQILAARQDGPFISQEEMVRRKIPKSVVEALRAGGLLAQIPQSSQISLFDL